MNTILDPESIRSEVRRRYGAIALAASEADGATRDAGKGGCCSSPSSPDAAGTTCGCGCSPDNQARTLGYSDADLTAAPEGANLGLGCGNPVALAMLRPGQTVLDLGSGAGFDAFLAARAVGAEGKVIGVDLTPEMIAKARGNARRSGAVNVEFRLGEIEMLPVGDALVDVVISNCVINLCPDKRAVYREAFRVLKPGGQLAVSDVVARGELPESVQRDPALHSGCLAGATPHDELLAILREVGFTGIVVRPKQNSAEVIGNWEAKAAFVDRVFAAEVLARKPLANEGSASSRDGG